MESLEEEGTCPLRSWTLMQILEEEGDRALNVTTTAHSGMHPVKKTRPQTGNLLAPPVQP